MPGAVHTLLYSDHVHLNVGLLTYVLEPTDN